MRINCKDIKKKSELNLRGFPDMLPSREKHFNLCKENMTNVACFHVNIFKIPLVLLVFAITLKGIDTLKGQSKDKKFKI